MSVRRYSGALPSPIDGLIRRRTLKPLQAGDNGTAVLEGTTVKLKAEAADLLNQTFGIDDLQGGMTIGIAKITINTSA